MKAMVLAAGLGTRLKPWTDNHPKALALISGKSLLQRNIEYLKQYGITDVVVNVHHFAEEIVEAIEKNKGWGSKITVSYEKDEPLETGGGLKQAAPFLEDSEDFILLNVDVLTDMDLNEMYNFHCSYKPFATLATTNRKTSRYFLFNKKDELCGWRNVLTCVEKISRKATEYFPKAFSGIHILNHAVFSFLKQEGNFSIVDVYLEVAKTETIKSFDHSNTKFIDVGKPESLMQAGEIFT